MPSKAAKIVDDPEEDQAEGAVQQQLSQGQEPTEKTPIRRFGRSSIRDTHRLYFTRSENSQMDVKKQVSLLLFAMAPFIFSSNHLIMEVVNDTTVLLSLFFCAILKRTIWISPLPPLQG